MNLVYVEINHSNPEQSETKEVNAQNLVEAVKEVFFKGDVDFSNQDAIDDYNGLLEGFVEHPNLFVNEVNEEVTYFFFKK